MRNALYCPVRLQGLVVNVGTKFAFAISIYFCGTGIEFPFSDHSLRIFHLCGVIEQLS